jgi:hypothetical protein
MSKKKIIKNTQWGGVRAGAGAKPRQGGTERICVSVTKMVWYDALKIWKGKGSQLVDRLLKRFVAKKATL